jgi:hypothetical protein
MKIINDTDVAYVKELLYELSILADPADYTKDEVEGITEMLDNLETIDVEAYLALSSYKPKEEDIHDQ